ncbi:MAG TPA: hypothetical protein VLG47_01290 [Candidatus Saccharimonadales bacterium]|nr:hypothetical protein [Candidatus Saccharimonadales bacterium]
MKQINVIHVGVGNVGGELVKQITAQKAGIKKNFELELIYCGMFTATDGIFKSDGLADKDIKSFPSGKQYDVKKAITEIPLPFILIDTTASDATVALHKLTLKRGGSVVMSNKKPVAGAQSDFDELMKYGEKRVLIETTVGAGLPVISTLHDLINTGDKIEQITGCFSGTLGYLFTELEDGVPFSKAVAAAKAQGFTEPDPRDDLSGVDVARKAVILARLMGCKIELKDVELQSLYPESMTKLSVEDFIKKLPALDKEFAKGFKSAMANEMIPRYIASVTPKKSTVGLAEVPFDSDIGALTGPDNIIIIQTKRYHDNPLIIKGPGAGVPVTAGGVFSDVLKAAGALAGA